MTTMSARARVRHWALVSCVGLAIGSCGTSGASSSGKGGSPGNGGATATGGLTGNGGTTATGGNVSLTCGDGNLDPGEDCDQSQLNGSTCKSLGFDSGTLACTSNCRFSTSGCSGSLTPVITASRTTCAAPCVVFFDATKTTSLMGNDYVNAGFDWNFDTSKVDPAAAHQQAIGFGVGHVFETPGTYQVGVIARDAAGHAGSSTVSITVSALTGATYYVASTGNDKNAGTTMAQPLATFAAAIAKAGPNVSVLFRRGDTFSTGSKTLQISSTGPCLIGAYSDPASPSSAAPILSSATTGGTSALLNILGASDTRLADVHIVSAGASDGITVTGSPNTLVERVEIEGVGKGANTEAGQVLYSETASNPTFFVDCHLHDFIGTGFYGNNVSHLAIIGTTIERFGDGEHGVRVQGGTFSFVASNTIVSNDTSPAMSGITIRGDNTNIVVANNHTNRLIEFLPQNETSLEHVVNGLADSNLINDTRAMPQFPSMNVTAQHIVIRNNVMVNGTAAVAVAGHPLLPKNFVDQLYIYNNTAYFFPTTFPVDYGANLVSIGGTTGSMVVQNNIFAHGLTLTNEQTAFINTDKMATVTENHNLGYAPKGQGTWKPGTGAGDVVGNPMFVSTDPNNANAFRLSTGSGATDLGVSVPVYQDSAGSPRPSGAGWDIGAFELQSP
jgi:hypothetical protein